MFFINPRSKVRWYGPNGTVFSGSILTCEGDWDFLEFPTNCLVRTDSTGIDYMINVSQLLEKPDWMTCSEKARMQSDGE